MRGGVIGSPQEVINGTIKVCSNFKKRIAGRNRTLLPLRNR